MTHPHQGAGEGAADKQYTVTAYHLTARFVRVMAPSAEEAVRLVREGQGECYDSEPGKDVFRPKWTAVLRAPLPPDARGRE